MADSATHRGTWCRLSLRIPAIWKHHAPVAASAHDRCSRLRVGVSEYGSVWKKGRWKKIVIWRIYPVSKQTHLWPFQLPNHTMRTILASHETSISIFPSCWCDTTWGSRSSTAGLLDYWGPETFPSIPVLGEQKGCFPWDFPCVSCRFPMDFPWMKFPGDRRDLFCLTILLHHSPHLL